MDRDLCPRIIIFDIDDCSLTFMVKIIPPYVKLDLEIHVYNLFLFFYDRETPEG